MTSDVENQIVSTTQSRYLDRIRRLPRPTNQQITNFIAYLTQAYAWYKHLPFLPPGEVFVFYLDPHASPNCHSEFYKKFSGSKSDGNYYQEKFGHLNYQYGHQNHLSQDAKLLLCIRNVDGELNRVPDKLVDSGSMRITSTLDDVFQEANLCFRSLLPDIRKAVSTSSGPFMMESFLERVDQFLADVDPEVFVDHRFRNKLHRHVRHWVNRCMREERISHLNSELWPDWMRDDWTRTSHQHTIDRVRKTIDAMLTQVYDTPTGNVVQEQTAPKNER